MKRYHSREQTHTVTTWRGKEKIEFVGTLREISEHFKIPLTKLRNRVYHRKLSAQRAVFFEDSEEKWQPWEDRIVLEEMNGVRGYGKRVLARLPDRTLRAIRHRALVLREKASQQQKDTGRICSADQLRLESATSGGHILPLDSERDRRVVTVEHSEAIPAWNCEAGRPA